MATGTEKVVLSLDAESGNNKCLQDIKSEPNIVQGYDLKDPDAGLSEQEILRNVSDFHAEPRPQRLTSLGSTLAFEDRPLAHSMALLYVGSILDWRILRHFLTISDIFSRSWIAPISEMPDSWDSRMTC